MGKVVFRPGTMLNPVPAVMVSCGDMEKHNIITIAWTGIINSDPPLTYISVRKERYSPSYNRGYRGIRHKSHDGEAGLCR